jgi:tetratricopeptide (TPR) repeat protein
VYLAGIAQVRAGQWPEALQSFELLRALYPDDAEVKDLLEQAHMRAALARIEPRRRPRPARPFNPRRLLVAAAVAALSVIAGYVAYEVWIGPVIVQELRLRQAAGLRSAAEDAVAAGDYAGARRALESLQAIFPEDAQTRETLRRVEQAETAASLYAEGQALMQAGGWEQAAQVFAELQALDAEYRDVAALLQLARESQALEGQFETAQAAMALGDWTAALAGFEAVQRASLTFRFEEVQAGLFDAHRNQAQSLLSHAGAGPEQVSRAIGHLSEALRLRPMHADVLRERRMAETFLAALQADDPDEAIDLLQAVYDERPDYAGQQAAQRLYESLLARAEAWLAAGDREAARADYQLAARLLVDDPSEAREKLAELVPETNP